MSTSIISKRYARALMNLAQNANQLEKVTTSLNDVADSLLEVPDLMEFMTHPKTPQTSRREALDEIVAGTKAEPLVASFVRLLLEKRRLVLIDEIRGLFHAIADERLGRAQAEITVAQEISKSQQESLQKKLEEISGKQITLTIKIDPEIIGGVVARIGSTVRDGSLRNHLKNIRQTIIEG